jgi:hypothetical protein
VLHEFRRYLRIAVMTVVSIVGDARPVNASGIEISSCGMSLKTLRISRPGRPSRFLSRC